MNIHLLRIVLAEVLLAISAAWCLAAPDPPRLGEPAILKVERPSGMIDGLIFSPDSKTLFSKDNSGIVRLWDVVNRKQVATLGPGIHRMTLSPDGKTLFSNSDNNVCLWDVASRKVTAILEHDLRKGSRLASLDLSADGKTIAALYGDDKSSYPFNAKTVVLWDVPSRKRIASLEEEHEIAWIELSSDGKILAAILSIRARVRDTLRIWDVAKGSRARSFEVGPMPIKVSGARLLARLGNLPPVPTRLPKPDTTISHKLIDPFTGDTVFTCEWDKKEGPHARLFASNGTGTMLATLGEAGPLRLWDKASGKCLATIKLPAIQVFPLIFSLFFSPDGKILFIGSRRSSGSLLYAVPSGKLLAEMGYGVDASARFSPDGRLLTSPDAWNIKLWSIPDEWRKKNK